MGEARHLLEELIRREQQRIEKYEWEGEEVDLGVLDQGTHQEVQTPGIYQIVYSTRKYV